MKNVKVLSRLTALLLVVIMAFSMLVACGDDEIIPTPTPDDGGNNNPATPPPTVTITVTPNTTAAYIEEGDTIQLTVEVGNTDNKGYTFVTEPAGILNVTAEGVVTVSPDANLTANTKVTIKAIADADKNAVATRSYFVKAPVKEGTVGLLTSDMIKEIGNMSITATGLVEDIYKDLLQPENNYTDAYDTLVKMQDGKWIGSWNIHGRKTVVTEQYRRNDESAEVFNNKGEAGRPLETVYIGKDNTLVAAPVRLNKTPVLWDTQHLWNHLGELDVNRFTQIDDTNQYAFEVDYSNEDEVMLMTYLSYFLTPMMTETFHALVLVVENGKITQLIAETAPIYYVGSTESDTQKDAEAMTQTRATFTFSDIGTTVVADPAPFEADENADKLQLAFNSLKDADNYTYSVVNTQTSAPSLNPDEYEMMSTSGVGGATMMEGTTATFPYSDKRAPTGTLGEVGYFADGKLVIVETTKYDYSDDNNLYVIDNFGFINNANGTYDSFEYQSAANGFVGLRNYKGDIKSEILPAFVLSASIFEYASYDARNDLYTFYLRENAAINDVARALAPHDYAKYAEATISDGALKVVVTGEGKMYSVSFSYNINDIYQGNYTVTYKNLGTTTIREGAFENYAPRVLPTDWSAFKDTYFYYLHKGCDADGRNYDCYKGVDQDGNAIWDHSAHHATCDVIVDHIFGTDAALVPGPDFFTNVFGDGMSTAVGFDYGDGYVADTYREFLSFNMNCRAEFEENDNYYQDLIAAFEEAVYALGFQKDTPNCDAGGYSENANRYLSYIKAGSSAENPGVQIVIHEQHSGYFYISIYKAGEWKLNK